jgi:hypothetical protein
MLHTEKCVKEINLRTSLLEAKVTVIGYFYDVDLGYGVKPQHHRIGKDLICTCGLGAGCPAVQAVAACLKDGGERTPEPPPGFFPVAPHTCPVCGAKAFFAPELGSRRRGTGWSCSKGRKSHYWQYHVNVLRVLFAANPWLFLPVHAQDGRLLYPGVRRDDVITEDTIVRE